MGACCSICTLFGRLCLAAIFLLAGSSKFLNWEGTAELMASKGFTLIPLFLIAAAVIEILGSLLLILGYKTRLAAIVLILFLIPTTLIFHDFWHIEEVEKNLQIALFFKNVAIAGGLLYVVGCGAGRISIDNFWGSNCEERPKPLN